ncbi:hypothetical protein N781_03635 [Pontibacillus halophilus JSM 076056 = DSM 19796]|uniref:DUF1659 domain-containing protein n=1 Tax=Pontibacillus halophilus JSM 076056 = DSM 19796 TaxID=1385510 RepID=A0A0A5I6Y6_9BACI|nr:DUF1659 domain-containing protein [Pontibacillus halophilus]KGX91592.1 hypothetical protein N781_03635 [Pontibacillus halophilus JSM 076056 = DSM 19796]
MANELLTSSNLKLVFESGLDEKGNMTFKTKSFGNIKTDVTADQLMSVAQSLASLQQLTLSSVKRTDVSDVLENE